MPLSAAGRTARLFWFQFGEQRPAAASLESERGVGNYALHILCPWRLSSVTGVVAGSSDISVPADPDQPDADLPGRRGGALVDAHLARWIAAYAERPLVVRQVVVDRCGGFVLTLAEEWALEVFPDASSAPHDIRVQWQLLDPTTERPPFVLLNHGIE